jgi:hypothetical protein
MDRRLKTLSFPLPSNLERKQQLSSVAEVQCAGVRQSWAIALSQRLTVAERLVTQFQHGKKVNLHYEHLWTNYSMCSRQLRTQEEASDEFAFEARLENKHS